MTRRYLTYALVFALVFVLGVGSAYADGPSPLAKNPVPGGGGPSGIEWAPEACTDILVDGSFEAGSPNPNWYEYSTNFGTPLCENGFCGSAGQSARTGIWWAWFGGIDSYEEGVLSQTLTIPNGAAVLSFWMWSDTPGTAAEDYLQVRIDSTSVFTVTGLDLGAYPDWTEIVLPMTAYANGLPHAIEFYSETGADGLVTNFHVDDAALCHTVPTSVSLVALDASPAESSLLPAALIGGLAVAAVALALVRRRRTA